MKKDETSKQENAEQNEEKTNGAVILGLLLGTTAGCAIDILTSQLMWIALGPAVGLMIGVIVSSIINNK